MHLIALALLFAAPVSSSRTGSSIPDNLPQGTMGLQFQTGIGGPFNPLGAPGPGAAGDVGVTYFIQPQVAARIDFGLNTILAPSGATGSAFDIQLSLRMYRARYDRLWIFLQPGAGFGRAGGGEYINFGAGVGAEYFFTDHFTVGGVVGIALAIDNIGGTPAGVGVGLSTGTSGLFAAFYF